MTAHKTPFVLVVLDGWGVRDDTEHNAIAEARTPFFDSLMRDYPNSVLDASGAAVGLPEGQMGNSEIGHMAIGAGAPIATDLVRINDAIKDGSFATNPVLTDLFAHVTAHSSTLHLVGLLSPGGIHSHSSHLHALVHAAVDNGVRSIALHPILDGRDTDPQSAALFLKELEDILAEVGTGRIATASGRFFAMDRDNNWHRLAKAEAALFEGEGHTTNDVPSEHLTKRYKSGALDEHLEPVVFLDEGGVARTIKDHDAVFVFNFRADRARMLATRLKARTEGKDVALATLTQYDAAQGLPAAFPPFRPTTTLAGEISIAGFSQAHIAETEKYAHATYFLNGGREEPHPGERHILIESRKDIDTHDQAPEMRAREITDAALAELEKGTHFLFINYANADMVGHTAQPTAIRIAIETLDRELGRLVTAVSDAGGTVLITADHGNAEQNVDPATGGMHTAHTTNLVPCILTDAAATLKDGTLCDIAPTVLAYIGLPTPEPMRGTILTQ